MNRWKVDSISFSTVYYMTYSLLNILAKETPRFWFQIWTDFNRLVLLLPSALNYTFSQLFLLFPHLN